jgi:hypothetical protein
MHLLAVVHEQARLLMLPLWARPPLHVYLLRALPLPVLPPLRVHLPRALPLPLQVLTLTLQLPNGHRALTGVAV